MSNISINWINIKNDSNIYKYVFSIYLLHVNFDFLKANLNIAITNKINIRDNALNGIILFI